LETIWEALKEAIHLIVSRDPTVIEITWRSLRISVTSTLLAALVCVPLGGLISFRSFPGKRFLLNLIQTLYSVPTVCVGLFVFLLICRSGPLGGEDGWVFTPAAMVLGQAVLIAPIMIGMTVSALSGVDKTIKDTTLSLGASEPQAIWAIIKEARFAMGAGLILGFGRAISEVGTAMMLGGNIVGYTRVLTTTIAWETGQGDFARALALGIILLCVALMMAVTVNVVQQRH
jgi:tungstate transport system permease protein